MHINLVGLRGKRSTAQLYCLLTKEVLPIKSLRGTCGHIKPPRTRKGLGVVISQIGRDIQCKRGVGIVHNKAALLNRVDRTLISHHLNRYSINTRKSGYIVVHLIEAYNDTLYLRNGIQQRIHLGLRIVSVTDILNGV